MVDAALRERLAQDARQLATGRMTNDEFMDAYWDVYIDSDDRAVRQIAMFCDALYSDTHTYRLRGRQALDVETKRTIARAVSFLRGDTEYQWPDMPDYRLGETLGSFLGYIAFPIGLALLIAAWVSAFNSLFATIYAAVGALLLCTSIGILRFLHRKHRSNWRAFEKAFDYTAWPFISKEQLGAARNCHHLLHSGRSG
jgi:hypothetical protein